MMTRKIKTSLSLVLISIIASSFIFINDHQEKSTLNLVVKNIKKVQGDIYVAVYDNEKDYMENRFAEAIEPVKSAGELEIELKLPLGKYAISIFHDVNSDTELSTNFLGIPKEPYGFSNNPKAKFGPPSYQESLFEFKEEGQIIEIELN